MKFYLGMRTWIWNMDRLHKIYKITFPCGNTYVGSTSIPFNCRYGNHRQEYKRSESPINKVVIQYKFKEVSMVEVDRIKCPMYDPRIKMLEQKLIKKLNPTLNTRQAHRTEEDHFGYHKGWRKNDGVRFLNYEREWVKTPQGKKTKTINSAKVNIKKYTNQNRPDMVKKWEERLKERLK